MKTKSELHECLRLIREDLKIVVDDISRTAKPVIGKGSSPALERAQASSYQALTAVREAMTWLE